MIRSTIAREVRKAWSDSAPLTAACLMMLVVFAASAAGIFLDHRIITGVPAWLKPAKFAISTAIYCGTLAWLFRYISVWPRFVAAMGWLVSVVLVLEVAIIDVQAARGTTSHFNVGTPLKGAPVTYAIGPKQYLAVQTSGRHLHPVKFDKLENSSYMFVFALN